MELNKNHRAALLDELTRAQEDLKINFDAGEKCKGGEVLPCHFDVGIYLAKSRIEVIEKAIIDNELHNY